MPALNLEHIACNVSDAVAVAAWYVENLGMQVVRKVSVAPSSSLARSRAETCAALDGATMASAISR